MLSFIVMMGWIIFGVVKATKIEDRTEPWYRLRALVSLASILIVGIVLSELAVWAATAT